MTDTEQRLVALIGTLKDIVTKHHAMHESTRRILDLHFTILRLLSNQEGIDEAERHERTQEAQRRAAAEVAELERLFNTSESDGNTDAAG